MYRRLRFIADLKFGDNDQEKGADWYDKAYAANDAMNNHYTQSSYYPLWTVVADRLEHANVTSVLDIGCGPGQVASLLHDQGLESYLGLDFSAERVARAREVCSAYTFVVADAFKTDLMETHDYDAVVCMEFLEHVMKDTEVLGRLKPGVYFLGTVPNFDYASHVRHFQDTHEVEERYGPFFRDFRVKTILENNQGKKFFLFEGYTRA
ncbi:MAG: class I SAM-dependent methyltransferase [Myxococcota bacterium]